MGEATALLGASGWRRKSMLERASMLEEHVTQTGEASMEEQAEEDEVISSDAEPVRTSSSRGGDEGGTSDEDEEFEEVPRELREIELEEGEAEELDSRRTRRGGGPRQQGGAEDEAGGVTGGARRKLGPLTGADSGEQDAATGAAGSKVGPMIGAGAEEEGGATMWPGSGIDGGQGSVNRQRLRRLRRGSAMLSSSGRSWGSSRGSKGPGLPSRKASARQQGEERSGGDTSEPS